MPESKRRMPSSITIGELRAYCEATYDVKYTTVFDFLNYFDSLSKSVKHNMYLRTITWLSNEIKKKEVNECTTK